MPKISKEPKEIGAISDLEELLAADPKLRTAYQVLVQNPKLGIKEADMRRKKSEPDLLARVDKIRAEARERREDPMEDLQRLWQNPEKINLAAARKLVALGIAEQDAKGVFRLKPQWLPAYQKLKERADWVSEDDLSDEEKKQVFALLGWEIAEELYRAKVREGELPERPEHLDYGYVAFERLKENPDGLTEDQFKEMGLASDAHFIPKDYAEHLYRLRPEYQGANASTPAGLAEKGRKNVGRALRGPKSPK